MLEKSLATLFALLILATLINRFLLWRLPERKGGEVTLRIRTWWGTVSYTHLTLPTICSV